MQSTKYLIFFIMILSNLQASSIEEILSHSIKIYGGEKNLKQLN